MIPRLVYSLLSLCSLAATTTTPRQTDAYTLSYDYSYTYDDDYTYDDYTYDDDYTSDDSASPTGTICVLRNTTVCWGNEHHYVDGLLLENTDFFDGIDVGFESAPALADLDDDGDLDLVVGELNGLLYYYENVGSAAVSYTHLTLPTKA